MCIFQKYKKVRIMLNVFYGGGMLKNPDMKFGA